MFHLPRVVTCFTVVGGCVCVCVFLFGSPKKMGVMITQKKGLETWRLKRSTVKVEYGKIYSSKRITWPPFHLRHLKQLLFESLFHRNLYQLLAKTQATPLLSQENITHTTKKHFLSPMFLETMHFPPPPPHTSSFHNIFPNQNNLSTTKIQVAVVWSLKNLTWRSVSLLDAPFLSDEDDEDLSHRGTRFHDNDHQPAAASPGCWKVYRRGRSLERGFTGLLFCPPPKLSGGYSKKITTHP